MKPFSVHLKARILSTRQGQKTEEAARQAGNLRCQTLSRALNPTTTNISPSFGKWKARSITTSPQTSLHLLTLSGSGHLMVFSFLTTPDAALLATNSLYFLFCESKSTQFKQLMHNCHLKEVGNGVHDSQDPPPLNSLT